MPKLTYIDIVTDHSEDSLFGSEGPPDTPYNPEELLDNLHKAVIKMYPTLADDEVTVIASDYKTAVDTDGGFEVEDNVLSVINSTWQDWLDQFEVN